MICNSCIHIAVCGKYQATGGHVRNCKHFVTENNVGCKWIPVTERLPEKDGRYLVFKQYYGGTWFDVLDFAKDGESVSRYDLENAKDVWFSYDIEWGYFSVDSVTHWMPLPEAPKEDK